MAGENVPKEKVKEAKEGGKGRRPRKGAKAQGLYRKAAKTLRTAEIFFNDTFIKVMNYVFTLL